MTTQNEAAERHGEAKLRERFSEWEYGHEWLAALDEALAAERRATVERIRERLREVHPALTYTLTVNELAAILDEEAAR